MSNPGDSTVDIVRNATRELARKFDYGYWREKDRLGDFLGEVGRAHLPERGGIDEIQVAADQLGERGMRAVA